MPLPTPDSEQGAAALDRIVQRPAEAVLSFDFDGTLAPIVSDPADARAYPGVTAELSRLAPLVGRLVIITGRPAAVAVEYGGLADVDGILVLGHYGLERWEDGRVTAPEPPAGVGLVREELPELLRKTGAHEGTAIEDKGRSLAVHTRRTADPDAALETLRIPLAALAQRAGLTVEPGRRVIELRPAGMDKGTALAGVAAGAGDGAAVLYVGDDLGDLAAFETVERLREKGQPGITVCSGSDEVAELAARADLVVDGPPGVADLLAALREAIDGR
ncbi:trehalose-phosphatase [Streptomonospora wellingtoniae]|uniref:Trehalose 6-phosphate phosphatase n=1 Tax=Streptomonospora wellingtoniae TaxID=3075544 RepID=A0ABU2KY27_9ACTN|nr:trehalose-phosphatase [Streptomonospora sp. DSM 45055]MDT0304206.1 trehalose-phosphatase [Streptomonospora sp. DSM 45055]